MIVVLFGPPGAGKGTQALKIVDSYSLVHISTGDILREAVASGSRLGALAKQYMEKGELVPDDVMVGIIREKVMESNSSKGFILDGFPRTIPQAEALEKVLEKEGLKIDAVLSLEVSDEEILARIRKRQEIEGRKDDSVEVAQNRLKVYRTQTEPLKDYYCSKGMLVEVDAVGSIDEVFHRVDSAMNYRANSATN